MDNGAAYLKYRQENPEINTFITTYEHLTMFPEQLTETEMIVLAHFFSDYSLCSCDIDLPDFFQKEKMMAGIQDSTTQALFSRPQPSLDAVRGAVRPCAQHHC